MPFRPHLPSQLCNRHGGGSSLRIRPRPAALRCLNPFSKSSAGSAPGVGPHFVLRVREYAGDEGGGGALPLGPRHVHCHPAALRVTETRQQAAHAALQGRQGAAVVRCSLLCSPGLRWAEKRHSSCWAVCGSDGLGLLPMIKQRLRCSPARPWQASPGRTPPPNRCRR